MRFSEPSLAGLVLAAHDRDRPAQAATELSTTDRLQDRRYVAAGDARVLDRLPGRPLLRQRLAHHRRDGRHLGAAAEARSTASGSAIDDQWVGPATKFTSGCGYTRYDLPPTRPG